MLRVRPVHYTSRPEQWGRLLRALGLVPTGQVGDGQGQDRQEYDRQEFDAGSGRLAVHRVPAGAAEDGSTEFAVEVGDVAEFARRTNESGAANGGTTAELIDSPAGRACRVTGADGFNFLAEPAAHRSTSPHADPGLAVTLAWLSPDPAGAARDLANIGARPRAGTAAPSFAAKNGGVIEVGTGPAAAAGPFGFEYDGALPALLGRLTTAGFAARIDTSAAGQVLVVGRPDEPPSSSSIYRPALLITVAGPGEPTT